MSDRKSAHLALDKIQIQGFSVMNQLPEVKISGLSPLSHAEFDTLAKGTMNKGGIHLSEKPLLGFLTLRCHSQERVQINVVETVLGVTFPITPLTSDESGACSIQWVSPDEWLIIVPGADVFNIEILLREKLSGHYSLVNGSGGLTVIALSGDNTIDLLKKCSPIDFHLSNFPIGKVVSTVFAKSNAIIRRKGLHQFELVIRRSFADYIWSWILDASNEFGLVINS